MRNLQDELTEARNRICELNADFIKELDKKHALSEKGKKRRIEDGKSWQELLKSMNIDLSKVSEHDKADAKKAEETLKEVTSGLKINPKEILSRAQDQVRIDEILNAVPTWDTPLYKRFFINNAISGTDTKYIWKLEGSTGTVEGDCGNITFGSGYPNEIMPRTLAIGDGSGFNDLEEFDLTCSLWFLIPREYIQQAGTLHVSPYFDIHGYNWDRANNGYGTYKEAGNLFTITTILHPQGRPATSSKWTVLGYYGVNIDESGRFDYTGHNSAASGTLQVVGDEIVLVEVVAELDVFTRGSGSIGLLDFQSGEGNAIKIPNLMCSFYQQPLVFHV